MESMFRLRVSLGSLGALSLVLAGCLSGHDHGGPEADEYLEPCGGAATTFASDESFRAFLNKEAAGAFVADDQRAPRLSSPTPGAVLSAAAPPTFMFDVLAAAGEWPARGGVARPSARPSLWARWGLVGTAHAHCPAVTGENYLLRLARDGETEPVFTALLSVRRYTPNADRWRKALAGRAGQTLKLTLARAVFSRGEIREGPFVATTAVSFTAGP